MPLAEGEHQASRTIKINSKFHTNRIDEDAQKRPYVDPKTYEQAIQCTTFGKQWKAAIEEELNSLVTNSTWKVVERPENCNIIGCKWVFKTKYDQSGRIERWKARLVAQGFSQQYGIDYTETFAPTLRLDSLRVLLALATHFDWEIHQADVITAFLAADLDETIYMNVPKGLQLSRLPGNTKTPVCQLLKGLIWLKAVRPKLE